MTEKLISITENKDLIPYYDSWCDEVRDELGCSDEVADQILQTAYAFYLNGNGFNPRTLVSVIKGGL